MSIESLAIALHHSRATGTAKLVLLGIANHDGDGGSWPAVATLAHYAGGITTRNVQKALDRLEQLGEIRRIRGAGGDHSTADYRRPNLYRFLLACPHDCDHTSQHRTRRRVALLSDPIELFPEVQPQLSTGVTKTTPPVAGDTGWGVGSDTQTIPLTQPPVKEIGSSRNRARACEKGHPLIAGERFCELGHYEHEEASA